MPMKWKNNLSVFRFLTNETIKLNASSPSFKAYLEIALSLTAITVFVVFAIRPTAITIIGLINQIKDKENKIEQIQLKISNLQKADALLQSIADKQDIINQAIPANHNLATMVQQIEKLAQENNVKVSNFSIIETNLNTKPLKDSLEFKLTLNANYQQLYNFLSSLEKLRRPTEILKISINTYETQTGNEISLTVTAKTPIL